MSCKEVLQKLLAPWFDCLSGPTFPYNDDLVLVQSDYLYYDHLDMPRYVFRKDRSKQIYSLELPSGDIYQVLESCWKLSKEKRIQFTTTEEAVEFALNLDADEIKDISFTPLKDSYMGCFIPASRFKQILTTARWCLLENRTLYHPGGNEPSPEYFQEAFYNCQFWHLRPQVMTAHLVECTCSYLRDAFKAETQYLCVHADDEYIDIEDFLEQLKTYYPQHFPNVNLRKELGLRKYIGLWFYSAFNKEKFAEQICLAVIDSMLDCYNKVEAEFNKKGS